MQGYDTLIVTLPRDYVRCRASQKRLVDLLPGDQIIYVGNAEIGELVSKEVFGSRVSSVLEDSIIPFDAVHQIVCDILGSKDVPRGVTGWYYQQFLKMEYARSCKKSYYMVWDGDTVPCKAFQMFDATDGRPFFDLKTEYHEPYFVTLQKIFPHMGKCLKKSFISEHMLISVEVMCQMLDEIEQNGLLNGVTFYEKILRCMSPQELLDSAFSEFETYGTYVTLRYPDMYHYRVWHSFRNAGAFLDPAAISEKTYAWFAKDIDALSFEKADELRDDCRNIFDNARYQERLSARQVLEIAQEEFKEGYIEVWD